MTQVYELARKAEPAFYCNGAIEALSDKPKWTISTNPPKDAASDVRKMPVNLDALTNTGQVFGASPYKPETMDTLPMSVERLAAISGGGLPQNHAYFLESSSDGCVVVDIEPECPPEVAAQLLSMPEALYIEESMSGKGYHIIMPLPPSWGDYPTARIKPALRNKKGWYELLLWHWCTFTRKTVDPPQGIKPAPWDKVFTQLAKECVENAPKINHGNYDVETPEDLDPALRKAEENAQLYSLQRYDVYRRSENAKELEDFDDDHSRFEYSRLTILARMATSQVFRQLVFALDGSLADAWAMGVSPESVFRVAAKCIQTGEILPWRQKHNEVREGMPFLLWRLSTIIDTIDIETIIEDDIDNDRIFYTKKDKK